MQILDKHYNTNYTAGWFLVRSGVSLEVNGVDPEGDMLTTDSNVACAASSGVLTVHRHKTLGPLQRARADLATLPSSLVPIMGDGRAVSEHLPYDIGRLPAGSLLAASMTPGPVRKSTLQVPTPGSLGTAPGANNYFHVWRREVLQDYRNFAPLHRGACNLLFADASVRPVVDLNDDGYLNNGFPANSLTGMAAGEVEMSPEDVASLYDLKAKVLPAP